MSERPIRVLVVDDSLTVRRHLMEVLGADQRFEVIGEAENGHAAIGLCDRLRPDVVTLDMVMPEVDGLAATEHIMAYFPTPILIVSASINRGEVFHTYDALAAGAVDVFEKPRALENGEAWATRFREQVRRVSRIKVITHPRLKLGGTRASAPIGVPEPRAPRPYTLVALGASTGGPSAIASIVRALPADFALPILVVLHIGEAFGPTFADWLQTQTSLPVRQAVDGEPLPPPGEARVIVAPAEHHLELAAGRLRVRRGPERHS
ncbi:MAG TPA: chemotaxis protein CheB, partial [Oscillatoriaceae cyanobacterium]